MSWFANIIPIKITTRIIIPLRTIVVLEDKAFVDILNIIARFNVHKNVLKIVQQIV